MEVLGPHDATGNKLGNQKSLVSEPEQTLIPIRFHPAIRPSTCWSGSVASDLLL